MSVAHRHRPRQLPRLWRTSSPALPQVAQAHRRHHLLGGYRRGVDLVRSGL